MRDTANGMCGNRLGYSLNLSHQSKLTLLANSTEIKKLPKKIKKSLKEPGFS
jgi:hypothetical protein